MIFEGFPEVKNKKTKISGRKKERDNLVVKERKILKDMKRRESEIVVFHEN